MEVGTAAHVNGLPVIILENDEYRVTGVTLKERYKYDRDHDAAKLEDSELYIKLFKSEDFTYDILGSTGARVILKRGAQAEFSILGYDPNYEVGKVVSCNLEQMLIDSPKEMTEEFFYWKSK